MLQREIIYLNLCLYFPCASVQFDFEQINIKGDSNKFRVPSLSKVIFESLQKSARYEENATLRALSEGSMTFSVCKHRLIGMLAQQESQTRFSVQRTLRSVLYPRFYSRSRDIFYSSEELKRRVTKVQRHEWSDFNITYQGRSRERKNVNTRYLAYFLFVVQIILEGIKDFRYSRRHCVSIFVSEEQLLSRDTRLRVNTQIDSTGKINAVLTLRARVR